VRRQRAGGGERWPIRVSEPVDRVVAAVTTKREVALRHIGKPNHLEVAVGVGLVGGAHEAIRVGAANAIDDERRTSMLERTERRSHAAREIRMRVRAVTPAEQDPVGLL
jgi:hypothetical protein